METIYSTAKVCLNKTHCVPLDLGVNELYLLQMCFESHDYDLLTTAWKGWRDVSGKKMKQLYSEYVDLSNEAVRLLDVLTRVPIGDPGMTLQHLKMMSGNSTYSVTPIMNSFTPSLAGN
ncbi:hypothetical protein Btru_030180 [Bulinus truncatus]|nr:hypothetical protein Btru_030180 [Bulinus truncatus]